MRVSVDVEIPEPRFKKGMTIVYADGTTYYVRNVYSSAEPATAVTGYGGGLQYGHEYVLVVQKSPQLRPGVIVLASEPGGWVNKCNVLRSVTGTVVDGDRIETIWERVKKPGVR